MINASATSRNPHRDPWSLFAIVMNLKTTFRSNYNSNRDNNKQILTCAMFWHICIMRVLCGNGASLGRTNGTWIWRWLNLHASWASWILNNSRPWSGHRGAFCRRRLRKLCTASWNLALHSICHVEFIFSCKPMAYQLHNLISFHIHLIKNTL